jgi:hypothetical protein
MGSNLAANNPVDRLVEVLAGSTALLSDPACATPDLPLSLTSLTGGDPGDTATDPSASGLVDGLALPTALAPASLSDDGAGLPVVGNILNSGTEGSTLHLAGPDGTVQPVLGSANTTILDVHAEIEALSHETGTSGIIHGLTNAGETIGLGKIGTVPAATDGHTNLITDLVNAPDTLLDGGGVPAVISQAGGDLTDIVNAVSALKDQVIFGSDPTNPIPDLISSLGHDLQTIPLLNINGGNNANDGGLIGGIVGDLSHSSNGHLVSADIGPEQSNGQVLNLLSAPTSGPHHSAEINAVDVGPHGPQLLDLGLLTGANGLNIPSLNGAGTDSLAGHLLGSGLASGGTTSAPVGTPLDLGVIHELVPAGLHTDHGILETHGTHLI